MSGKSRAAPRSATWATSPEKRVSWTDRPEYTGQVSELMNLIDWSRLDGPGVVRNFLVRRVMPYQRRVHLAYEYVGIQDPTRMHRDGLEKAEVQRLTNELFNLTDDNFVRSDDRMHAFKLGRPAPKVKEYLCLFVLLREYGSLLTDDLSLLYSRWETLTGARCMCHWHPVWTILLGWTRRQAMVLGVSNTPAAKRTRPGQYRPWKTGQRERGQRL